MEQEPALVSRGGPGPRRWPWGAAGAGLGIFLVVSGAAGAAYRTPLFAQGVTQPVAFNHRKHVKDNELPCKTCHEFYETETFSGLPSAEVCSSCHADALGKSAQEARLRALLAAGRPLVWPSLFRQPAHVFYSHRRHVVDAGLQCPTCHGAIAESERPPVRVRRLAMADCVGCHQQKGVSTACTTCHR